MNHLCIFDMDETLLSPDKTVSEGNLEALRKLRELDIGFSIATGRSPFLTGKYIDMLSLSLPVIACNGGMLISTDWKDVIWENPIEKTLLNSLFLYLLKEGADFVAYTSDMVYYAENSVRVMTFVNYNRTVPARRQVPLTKFSYGDLEKPLRDIVKILFYSPSPEQEAFIRGIPGLEVVSSGESFLDIMQDGSTKGNAVRALGKYLGIPVENIAVFGDNENDLSMFACGALSIAMGNSRDEIKEKARYVTGTNKESGVAQGIYKYVLPHFGFES